LDSKSLKAATIYDIVVKDLEKLGIVRTATQVQQKWQSLWKIHRAGKSVNGTSGEKGIDTDQDVSGSWTTDPVQDSWAVG